MHTYSYLGNSVEQHAEKMSSLDRSNYACLDKSMSTSTQPTHLRLSDAAAIIGVHPETLRRWADAGKVRSFRTPGNQRRFDRVDIEQLLIASPAR